MSGRLDPPDGLHEAVPDNDADVGSGVALCLFAQHDKVLVLQAVGCGAQVQFEHVGASVCLRQRNIDALFKSWRGRKRKKGPSVQELSSIFCKNVEFYVPYFSDYKSHLIS